jgi:hypothetical protein
MIWKTKTRCLYQIATVQKLKFIVEHNIWFVHNQCHRQKVECALSLHDFSWNWKTKTSYFSLYTLCFKGDRIFKRFFSCLYSLSDHPQPLRLIYKIYHSNTRPHPWLHTYTYAHIYDNNPTFAVGDFGTKLTSARQGYIATVRQNQFISEHIGRCVCACVVSKQVSMQMW